jgi:hypothetical protein
MFRLILFIALIGCASSPPPKKERTWLDHKRAHSPECYLNQKLDLVCPGRLPAEFEKVLPGDGE